MSFLAPWALAIGLLASVGMAVLHLIARQRPAAFMLPTTRFIPDQRTLVSRVTTQPNDLLLLALRVLLLLCASAAFARPALTPARGTIARVVLLDRSRAVANAAEGVAKARALVSDGAPATIIAFDSISAVLTAPAWDSLAGAPRSNATGSLSAALVAARRASAALAERADSVQLIVVSPLAASEFDAATERIRREWPGALRLERVALRRDSSTAWQLARTVSTADPLGPSVAAVRAGDGAFVTRLVRGAPTPGDSAFAMRGGTVVRWDSAAAGRPQPEGLAAGGEVIVAALGRAPLPAKGRVIARWADGAAAAMEAPLGKGCVREVGIALPVAGDIALHAPFQRMARALLAPCGLLAAERPADSSRVARLMGANRDAASAALLRTEDARPTPLARWLLALAILLAIAEMVVRQRAAPEPA